jgi:subtilase family serine protease
MRHAYGIDKIADEGEGQIIGIVDGFNYPEVEADLAVFDQQFGLPDCTTANGCLTVVYASGTVPPNNKGWTGETSLDVQWSHAIAPKAKIVLVLAENGNTSTLLAAVPIAVNYGATVVNMSWGTLFEFPIEKYLDQNFFSDSSVTYFNASGDDGHNLFGYPAASPLVVDCGGTTMVLNASGGIASETAWSGSGGGLSKYYEEPAYQMGVQTTGMRSVPDVAYDSSPFTGVATYDSEYSPAWSAAGGTSASSPQWSALTAVANSLRAAVGKGTIGANFQSVLYANASALHDITSGSNGSCGADCTAGPGYDLVTGLGSPDAPKVIAALVAAP